VFVFSRTFIIRCRYLLNTIKVWGRSVFVVFFCCKINFTFVCALAFRSCLLKWWKWSFMPTNSRNSNKWLVWCLRHSTGCQKLMWNFFLFIKTFSTAQRMEERKSERERDSERENKVYLRITVCIFFHPFLWQS